MIYTLFKLLDVFIFIYFLYYGGILGWLVAALSAYRLYKSFLPSGTGLAYKFVDCTYHHRKNDGHRHVGVKLQ